MSRRVLIVRHEWRPQAVTAADDAESRLRALGIEPVHELGDRPGEDPELVLVLGGDGTLLRAAELVRGRDIPLIGVNLGHVGFLAEAEVAGLADTVDSVVAGRYDVEERMTIDVLARQNGNLIADTWALNEVTVEKQERMLEVVAEIDGRPLSRWGCDGVICATPTGSTAHAFSAGGPVVWPEVEALLMVPISAHALFARPLVVSPRSTLAVEILPDTPGGVMWCDGRRRVDLPSGTRVEVRRGAEPVLLARLHGVESTGAPFTDRLVAKFELPVQGWRGRARP